MENNPIERIALALESIAESLCQIAGGVNLSDGTGLTDVVSFHLDEIHETLKNSC